MRSKRAPQNICQHRFEFGRPNCCLACACTMYLYMITLYQLIHALGHNTIAWVLHCDRVNGLYLSPVTTKQIQFMITALHIFSLLGSGTINNRCESVINDSFWHQLVWIFGGTEPHICSVAQYLQDYMELLVNCDFSAGWSLFWFNNHA